MSLADRAAATLGFHLQQIFSRKLADAAPLPGAVEAPAMSDLRYRLRRDGLRPALLTECFALPPAASAAHVRAAARRLAAGGVVELADPQERGQALALAALALALHGDSVHVIAAAESGAQALHQMLDGLLSGLGLRVGIVPRSASAAARREAYACDIVCGTHREIAQDYLRDRLLVGDRQGGMRTRLRLSAGDDEPLMRQGLRCALVDDADIVMLDDAVAPAAIATDVDQARERLLYEQAVELARALAPGADFTVEAEGIRLTEPATRLLERLVTPLAGIWSARRRREELVGLALQAMHGLQRDVDYRVVNGRVEFPERPKDGEEAGGPGEEIRKLVEVKEGCRLSARRELLARLPIPRFFARYPHLAGVCADARSLEAEFWGFYSLKTWLAGPRRNAPRPALRVFASSEARNAALLAAVRLHAAAGRSVALAVRSPRDAQAVQLLLRDAQLEAGLAIAVLPAVQRMPAATQVVLVVVGLPDSRRHIEQARRAFGADSCELLFALDEEAVAPGVGRFFAFASRFFVGPDGEIASRWAAVLANRAQLAAERASSGIRLDLKAREEMLDDLLAFSGQRE